MSHIAPPSPHVFESASARLAAAMGPHKMKYALHPRNIPTDAHACLEGNRSGLCELAMSEVYGMGT